MDLAGVVKDVLLLSKARSEVVAEQMTRRVAHKVDVTVTRERVMPFQQDSWAHSWGVTEPYLWDPSTERLEPYDSSHANETGLRNALAARGYVEEDRESPGAAQHGRFEVLVPVRELQRIYMRPVKRARPNPSDIES